MKVLIISAMPTHPTFAGSRFGILTNCKLIQQLGHHVQYLWVRTEVVDPTEEAEMNAFWGNGLHSFVKPKIQGYVDKFYRNIRFKRTGNYHVDDLFPFGLSGFLRKLQAKNQYDCVVVHYVFLSKAFLAFPQARKILFTHDMFIDRYKKTGDHWFSTTAGQESKALLRADIVWAVQEKEASVFESLVPRKVVTMFGYFEPKPTPFVGNRVLLFFSGANPHNINAITKFIEDVLPLVTKRYPDITLVIGGSVCRSIPSVAGKHVELYGEVDDLEEFYRLGDIFVNPTYSGTGLKIKTFEAMAFGKAQISHPHNLEGIYKKNSAPLLVAQTAAEYLDAFDRLFGDEAFLRTLKERAISYSGEFAEVVRDRVRESVENTLGSFPPAVE